MGWREDVKFGISRVSRLFLGDAGGQMGVEVTATAAELNILDGVTATAAEINAAADKSLASIFSINGDEVITQAEHAGKICVLNKAAGLAITMPEATGTGDIYTFILGTVLTGGAIVFSVADLTNCDLTGNVVGLDQDFATVGVWFSAVQAGGLDTYTMNRTTTGGVNIGCDWVRFTDIKADLFSVEGQYLVPAGSDPATPFGAT
jgi:hypothetical protein